MDATYMRVRPICEDIRYVFSFISFTVVHHLIYCRPRRMVVSCRILMRQSWRRPLRNSLLYRSSSIPTANSSDNIKRSYKSTAWNNRLAFSLNPSHPITTTLPSSPHFTPMHAGLSHVEISAEGCIYSNNSCILHWPFQQSVMIKPWNNFFNTMLGASKSLISGYTYVEKCFIGFGGWSHLVGAEGSLCCSYWSCWEKILVEKLYLPKHFFSSENGDKTMYKHQNDLYFVFGVKNFAVESW